VITGNGGPGGEHSGTGMQIMGAAASDDVQIMGGAEGVEIMGFGADPLIPAPGGGTQTTANAMFVANQRGKNLSTGEKIGAVAVVLLLAGGVAYAMHKK
jgi:hypothetical protein